MRPDQLARRRRVGGGRVVVAAAAAAAVAAAERAHDLHRYAAVPDEQRPPRASQRVAHPGHVLDVADRPRHRRGDVSAARLRDDGRRADADE